MKEGWENIKLLDVCEKTNNIKWAQLNGESFKYVDLSSVSRETLIITESSIINKSNAPSRAKKIIKSDDIIFATTRPTLKRVTRINDDFNNQICSTGYCVLRPQKDKITSKFIYYFILTDEFMNRMESLQRGASYPAVSDKDVKSTSLNLPPLPEQKAIVKILDETFRKIDQAKANIEKNIENAKELFQSKLNEIFSQRGEGWEEKKLGEVCVVERGSSPRPIKNFLTESLDGVNWIKIGDVGENSKYVTQTKQKITKKGAQKSRFVGPGDFILSNSMSFGRPYIMKIEGYIHDGWFVLRLPDYINPDYFWQLLASPYLKNQFNNLAAGAIVKNISGDLVKKSIIPVPPKQEQAEIAKKTELLRKTLNDIEIQYTSKIDSLEELKNSILQKAFLGELTKSEAIA